MERTDAGVSGKDGGAGGRRCATLARVLAALFLLILPALPLPHTPVRAQRVEAHLLADSVKAGERFRLALTADHNFMTQARFPAAQADSGAVGAGRFGDLVVLALRDSSQRYLGQGGTRRDSVVYEVATFALDTARVGTVPVAFVQDGDTARVIRTETHRLPVVSVLSPSARDSASLKPLTPPASFPRTLWPWLLGGAGLLALAALLAYLWYDRDEEEEEEADATSRQPPMPPAEAARQHLRRLEETTDLADPDAAKPFYDDLSATLRRYLMHRLGLRTFRSTTREVTERLQQRADEGALPAAVPERARRALEGADLAKFADQRPAAEARKDALADARAVVDAVEKALQPAGEATEEAETDAPAGASP
jgi:hypothetical protein